MRGRLTRLDNPDWITGDSSDEDSNATVELEGHAGDYLPEPLSDNSDLEMSPSEAANPEKCLFRRRQLREFRMNQEHADYLRSITDALSDVTTTVVSTVKGFFSSIFSRFTL